MRFCPLCLSLYAERRATCALDGAGLQEEGAEDPLVGRLVDRYRMEARLGVGANGAVYRATHDFLGSSHAVKVLFGELSGRPNVVERLRLEAQAVSAMVHPNIVSITDFGTSETGVTFLVMELLEGETMDRLLTRVGPMVPTRAVRFVRQIAAGLQEAHRLGYVHRDVKPANVMVCGAEGKEHLKLLDFGIVGTTDPAGGSSRITGSGQFVGTPMYMAPEQARDPESVGPASDLYALGVVLYEMISGAPPFDAPDMVDLVKLHARAPVPELEADAGLVRLVHRLLAKFPEHRPRSAEEVIEALDALQLPEVAAHPRVIGSSEGGPETVEMALDPYLEETPFEVIEQAMARLESDPAAGDS